MAVKEILRMGNPLLRKKSSSVPIEDIKTEKIKTLITDLFDTMKENDGIGIAAPQVGENIQLAIIGIEEENPRYPDQSSTKFYTVFNPKIKVLDKETQGFWEGCLSVPYLRGLVERPRKIQINYLDENAIEQTLIVEDFLATVFQHEIDHLDGVLYVDRIQDTTKLSYLEEFSKFWIEEE